MNTPYALEDLLPHRHPMLLLDAIVQVSETSAQARVLVTRDSAFFSAALGGVPAWVGMEYMAQAIGLWIGYRHRQAGMPIKPGFLLGTRLFECEHALFPVGTGLLVDVTNVYFDNEGIGSFHCTLHTDSLVARAQIKAFLPDNPDDFIRQAS